ncbi:ABC transporter substrate-binding protein [Natronospirillum operosum]|uniref:ABC transporter substrate-binding protein n=1 Tax=Natronospirillum operosum TaxID=2759953 RepID=A0A4Z0WJK8_9GAMM|nr:ABC transporter substrate-binding protein [Natronospirillum operosum]TGG95335.1 ABC transporter substrate-binding protein [Natronospirillum operosum]
MTKQSSKPRLTSLAAMAAIAGFSATLATAQERVAPIELITTTESYDPIRYEAAFMIAERWRELGFEVSVAPTEFSTALERFYDQQDFDATILGWSGRVDRLDPQFFLSTLDSRQAGLSGNNPGGYDNPDYDALLDEQSREFDVDRRQQLVREMQELYKPDMPLVVLFHRDEVVAYNHTTFDGFEPMAGEGLYSEWGPMEAVPQGDRQTLRIGGPQEPDNLNPLDSTSVWGWKWMRLYYDRLVRLSADVEPLPWAAAEVNAIDDTTVEVVLREGMTFHDGEPLTAEDVAFTFNYYLDQEYSYFASYTSVLDNAEVVDERTVRFNLNEPSASFASITLSQLPILPQHHWEDIEDASTLAPEDIPMVGSGPFQFERFDRGEFMAISRFEDHFHADEIAVDGVEFIIYADMEGVYTGLQTGEIDMTAWRMEPGQIGLAEDQDHLTVVSVPDFGYFHMTYNLRREPFDDRAVRRALAMASDRERMVDVLLEGRGEVGSSVIAPVNTFWHEPFVERLDFDMDAAREELEEAGYSWDDDGYLVH